MPQLDRPCSGYCFRQVDACLRLANLNISPADRQAFSAMAAHWTGIAKECGGRLHPWTYWCHQQECADELSLASSVFVAQFISEVEPDTANHAREVSDAYRAAPDV
jgi:hypothetical protein